MEEPVVNILGEKVALGPLRRDLVPLYHRWRNDFYVQRTFGDLPAPVTLEAWEERIEERAKGEDAFWFTIYERSTWRACGLTDLFSVDHRLGVAQFGMMIGEADCRAKGYGTETARLMLDYAFTALGLHNVMLTVSEYNLAGRRVYEKAGFREFGRRRQADPLAGKRWDEIYMDCLSTEFTSPLLDRIFQPDQPRTT